jgi:hypothetical protein
MNDFFNDFDKNSITNAVTASMYAEEMEKKQRQKELERQKKELYDNKVLEVAEQTRDIEKQNLTISKKIFRITKITLVVAIASGIISLIALFKG